MWGQRIPCTINAYVAYAAEDRFCSGDEPNHTACCPSLNSAAQPWPLPGCNHSPGGAIFNSSLTTKALSLFLTGQEDEPHLPFQGAESMFTTTREAIG